jgi:predicted GIY-YIG superfamily endonuclease
MNPATWFVYIMSNRAHTLYVGYTNDMLRRYREHRVKRAFTAR